MSAVAIHIATKRYTSSNTLALEDFDLDVGRGQFVAIVGPSGAGKTSLLNVVAGLDSEFDGHLSMGSQATPTSMVFQTPRLMPWLTVTDNIRLVLGPKSDDSAIRALLREFELSEFEDAFPGQLSGGMQRRVSLARAFAVNPRLLLMDEPFLSLDEPLALRLRQLLMTMWSKHRPTVLYVTHNLDEALSLAERIVFMSPRPGRVVLDMPIALAHPRDASDARVIELKQHLLQGHPRILSGLTEASDVARPLAASESQAASGYLRSSRAQ